MSLERQILEHADLITQRVKDPDVARMLRADLVVVAALAVRDYAVTRTIEVLLAHAATLLEHTALARPSDAEIVESVRIIGVRATARLTGVSRSTVSRISRAVPFGTPGTLLTAEPERMVGAFGVMVAGGGASASRLFTEAPPSVADTGDDEAMYGTKREEVISPQAVIPVLLERVSRLERLPANAAEVEAREAERLKIRRRLGEERLALIEALANEGVALHKRVQKALHELDYASGPTARAKAQEALSTLLLQQQANSAAAELKPAELAKTLRATADPRLDELREWLEGETAANRCYGPPFVPNTLTERERMIEDARLAPPPDDGPRQFDNPRRNDFVLNVPFLHGGYDQNVQKALNARVAALRAAHARTHELKLLPLTAAQVTQEIDALRAGIPQIPADASLNAPLPKVREVDLSEILQVRKADGSIEQVEARDGRREAPKRMPPDGTRYINGVPQ